MDLSFEDKFCQHFVTLKKCFEVFVSFNINQWQSGRTDKTTIFLFYNGKLDIEIKEDIQTNLQKSVNLTNVIGKFLAKLQLIFQIFTMSIYLLIEILDMLLTSSLDEQLTRPLYTVTLPLTNRKENDGINLSLYKNLLNLIMLIVSYKPLQYFCVSASEINQFKKRKMENSISYYQKCKKMNCNFHSYFKIFLNNYDDDGNCVLDETQK